MPQLWTPALIPTNIWYDAADPSAIVEDSGAITSWLDKSGNDNHAFQSTASARPLVTADSIGGNTALIFDGSNDYLEITDEFSLPTDYYEYAVFNRPAANRHVSIMSHNIGGGQERPFSFWWHGANNVRYLALGTGTMNRGGSGDFGDYLVVTAKEGSLNRCWLDGTELGSPSTNGGTAVPLKYIGRITAYSANMALGEVITVHAATPLADRQLIEGYLAWKWGLESKLPLAHPYKSEPPYAPVLLSDLTVYPGSGLVAASVTTNTSPGVIDWVVTYTPEPPTMEQIQAGTDSFDSPAPSFGYVPVTVEGAQPILTSLEDGVYYLHCVQDDGEDGSNVVTSSQFTVVVTNVNNEVFATYAVFFSSKKIDNGGGVDPGPEDRDPSMAEGNIIIKSRRDVASRWTEVNPVLALGEQGLETDTYQYKVGDGVTPWEQLPYWAPRVRIKFVPTATYELSPADENTCLICTNVGGCEVTLPKTQEAGLPIGYLCHIHQDAVGQVELIQDTGVQANTAISLKTRVRNSSLSVLVQSPNIYKVIGDAEYE